MNFYVHAGSEEPTGTEGRLVWRDLKTRSGAIRRAMKQYPGGFSLYSFTNVYDEKTYKMIHIYTPQGIPGLL
jgi:hypothetical protein